MKLSYTSWLKFNRERIESEYFALHPNDTDAVFSMTKGKSEYFWEQYKKYIEGSED